MVQRIKATATINYFAKDNLLEAVYWWKFSKVGLFHVYIRVPA